MDNLMLGWLVRQLEDERVQSLISESDSTSDDSEEEDAANGCNKKD